MWFKSSSMAGRSFSHRVWRIEGIRPASRMETDRRKSYSFNIVFHAALYFVHPVPVVQ